MSTEARMVDLNGVEVTSGAQCRFWCSLRSEWLPGTVRRVRTHTYHHSVGRSDLVWEARVDDGDPANPDLTENGFSVAACVESHNIEILGSAQ